jgi:D-glycerate 3-kinase
VNSNSIAVLIHDLIGDIRARRPDRPALVGVAGAQGSGKTYLCQLLEAANRPRFAHFSLDDVYLTKAQRLAKSRDAHPLFVTRGPPGGHDLQLLAALLDRLEGAEADAETALPRFDKMTDDRAAQNTWPVFKGRPEAILLDGWCVGALPDALGPAPLNRLEADEDRDGSWRAAVQNALAGGYQSCFDRLDAIVYLQAPNWTIVRRWRAQQEVQMLGRAMTAPETAKLDRFLMHYERITKSMMAGGHRASHVIELDAARTPMPSKSTV